MTTRLFRSAVCLGLLVQVQSQICQAQGNLSQRQRAIVAAVLFARGSASEELRTIPSDQILVDATGLLENSSQLDVVAMGKQLRANVTLQSHGKCDQGLTGDRAAFARARCATAVSRYYVEPGDLQIRGDVAVILIQVFKRGDPFGPAKPPASQSGTDYSGPMIHGSFNIQLTLGPNGWGSPRLLAVSAT
jgi:hypothetical protein